MKKIFCSLFLFLFFSYNAFAAETGVVYMAGEFLDGDILKISVLTKDVLYPVLGVAFHLDYEPKKVEFLKYEPGDFFEKGGDPFYLVSENKNSKIIFGETLRRNDNFPAGSGKISDLYFQILDGENFNFNFENGVLSPSEIIMQDIYNVQFENFSLSKNDNQISLKESGKINLITNQIRTNIASFLPIIVVFSAILLSILLIIIIKKRDKKRAQPYVNFK